jgi:hypothetical protein
MTRNITLGLVQMEMDQDPSRNMVHAEEMIREAKRQGADIVCLPELFTSLYFAQYPNPDGSARKGVPIEEIPGGNGTSAVRMCPGKCRDPGRGVRLRARG